MKKVNSAGPKTFGGLPPVPALPAADLKRRWRVGATCCSTPGISSALEEGISRERSTSPRDAELSVWAGRMLEFDDSILLVMESDEQLERVVTLLWRTAYTNFGGYLAGGMKAWETSGFDFEELPQMSVHDVRNNGANVQVLDVRTPAEWESGHIPGAVHIFVPDVRKQLEQLDRSKPVIAYCDSGFRANIAASILRQEGFERVCSVPGSMQAWKSAGYPLETP